MELKLFDTLTKEKQVFRPLDPNNVRMYVCGPTVYDFAHIGNARPVIVFDVLFRLLRHVYGADHVTYVRNITDVDDKINARAARDFPGLPLNDAIRQVTEKTEAQFHADVAALGCLPPTFEPRATEHITEMRALIEALVARGHAYVEQDHVLFAVGTMKSYGKLARRSLDEMMAGARVETAPYKRDAMDFVLWKPSKEGEPGWPSPCGINALGRPGWHIECSAMSMAKLLEPFGGGLTCDDPNKNVFDIHGGGIDLVFPHHENEIAQSCCAFGTERMANIWMHNGFLQVEGEKMSKSLGNFVTIRELLDEWPGAVLRHNMLKTHYRQPIDWTKKGLEESQKELRSWLAELTREKLWALKNNENPYQSKSWDNFRMPQEVAEALSDDLNFSDARVLLQAYAKQSSQGDENARLNLLYSVCSLGFVHKRTVMSLFGSINVASGTNWNNELAADVEKYRVAVCNDDLPKALSIFNKYRTQGITIEKNEIGHLDVSGEEGGADLIDTLIAARAAARAAKDWKESDRIRDELSKMGIVLKDGKDENGNPTTTWEIAR
jgi:cysteinyl-tRNA synthetase